MVEMPSLLITDDDRALRETLGSVFAPRGYRTWLAANGEEAVRIVRGERIHIVLLDMHMPRLTGLETIRLIKQLRNPLPCILMSAALDDDIRREAVAAHAFSVLPKPVSFQELTRTVEQALAAFESENRNS